MKFIAVVNNKKEINSIAQILSEMGCSIEHVLKTTGVITGDSGKKKLQTLRIDGIRSIEPEKKLVAKSATRKH